MSSRLFLVNNICGFFPCCDSWLCARGSDGNGGDDANAGASSVGNEQVMGAPVVPLMFRATLSCMPSLTLQWFDHTEHGAIELGNVHIPSTEVTHSFLEWWMSMPAPLMEELWCTSVATDVQQLMAAKAAQAAAA